MEHWKFSQQSPVPAARMSGHVKSGQVADGGSASSLATSHLFHSIPVLNRAETPATMPAPNGNTVSTHSRAHFQLATFQLSATVGAATLVPRSQTGRASMLAHGFPRLGPCLGPQCFILSHSEVGECHCFISVPPTAAWSTTNATLFIRTCDHTFLQAHRTRIRVAKRHTNKKQNKTKQHNTTQQNTTKHQGQEGMERSDELQQKVRIAEEQLARTSASPKAIRLRLRRRRQTFMRRSSDWPGRDGT